MTHVAEEDEQFLTNGELHVIDPNETEYELLKENGVFERNRQPRDVLPMTREKSSLRNWFSFLKTVIGKDLTKVTFPVCFNEPISFLQRLCEDLQYAYLLEKAASKHGMVFTCGNMIPLSMFSIEECESSVESLVYIAAFMVSSFSTVPGRFMKPFNPLLGETYEYINKEYGYAVLVEQVSHHPPMSALHAESEDWIFWEEYKLDTKFRGQYVRVCPTGIVHLKFKKSGDHYSWKKPETIVHNIIFGTLWVEHDGDVVIKNHRTKEVCTVHFQPYNRVKEHYKMITGEVRDLNGHVCLLLDGNYEDYVEYTSVEKGLTADPIQVWKAVPKPEISPRMYGLTTFAMQLNEPDAEVQCTTDCRKRPDLRNLEDGNMDEASREKCRLENKQRQARKHRENEKKIWSPRWFKVEEDPDMGISSYVYQGGYWRSKCEGKFDNTPDIF